MNWFIECLKKYTTFSGRARRKEYWMWALVCCLINFALQFAGGFFGAITESEAIVGLFGMISLIFGLAVILPGASVCVRRLHDIDKSGWWFWIALVPIIGWIAVLVFYCTEGTKGPNRFGPDPKSNEIQA